MMKRKSSKWKQLFIIFFIMMPFMSACGNENSAKLVNEITVSLEDISDLTISYDDENVRFFTSQDDNLIIREYMSKDKKSYHAKISKKKGSLQISEGGKPFFKGDFIRYVEVYLPVSYSSNLKVTTTDGNIDLSGMELKMESIRVDTTSGTLKIDKAAAAEIFLSSTSGTLELGEIFADQIKIETTSGNVVCKKAEGKVVYTSTSGNAQFLSASGSGTYKANNSGTLSVIYDEVTDDLVFYNKNDDVEVKLPENLEFEFEGMTKNGEIDTDFQDNISLKDDSVRATVGKNPVVTIKAETKNGTIKVER